MALGKAANSARHPAEAIGVPEVPVVSGSGDVPGDGVDPDPAADPEAPDPVVPEPVLASRPRLVVPVPPEAAGVVASSDDGGGLGVNLPSDVSRQPNSSTPAGPLRGRVAAVKDVWVEGEAMAEGQSALPVVPRPPETVPAPDLGHGLGNGAGHGAAEVASPETPLLALGVGSSVAADEGIVTTGALRVDTAPLRGDAGHLPTPVAADQAVPPPVGEGQPGVRQVVISKRGKRDFNYSWPKEDVQAMKAAWARYRPMYRQHWKAVDPAGSYGLVFSAFVAVALQEALGEPGEWLGTVRNDARKEPVVGGRSQVGLVWPVEVEEQVVALWEAVDPEVFGEGFAVTKQHLAAAAILHGLKSADRWYLSVPNDDRFSVPVAADGRLRDNKQAVVTTTSP